LNGLAEYVDTKGLSVKEVTEALNLSGTENEVLSELKDFPGIVVGEILEIQKHPNADRLNVTQTKVGKEVRQIVCGAPNIEVGQKVPVALPGAMMGEFEIKETEIRGVKSSGMLCSEQELGISEDHEGIMVLDPTIKVGVSFAKALKTGGPIIDAELTPNRPDCFSVIGIAREVAASTGNKMKSLNFKSAAESSQEKIEVEVKEKELCPRYIAKTIEGVSVVESPDWLKRRLEQSGIRPINNVVDATNYVMLEWGQPLHAFDKSKVVGKIVIRQAKKGEVLETLDGVKRKLSEQDLLIADSKKVIGIAGVMGAANSEVDTKTKDIILEAAVFNGTSVRKTAQRLALRTEASTRFEKGVPLSLPEIAIERAAELIIKTGGGKAAPKNDVLSAWIWKQHVGVRLSKIKESIGAEIGAERAIEILKSLGFEAEKFDFKKEARKHVGKPYVFGARYKTHGDLAFDCSYLTDYIYSRVGKFIGYTSLAQFELGDPVAIENLQAGDVLFVNGIIDKSVTDHYFVPDGKGGYKKLEAKLGQKVGHNAIYIGGGRIVHARHYEYDFNSKKWIKGKKAAVVEEDLETFTENPEYIGARRFVKDPNDWIAASVPWWRLDVKIEEDVLEELSRIFGYDNIPSALPAGQMPALQKNIEVDASSVFRNILCSVGFSEVINYSFYGDDEILSNEDRENSYIISNPISVEQKYMRTSLVPLLLKNARLNQANYSSYNVFELGKTYSKKEEKLQLGMIARVAEKNKEDAFFELKGAINILAQKLNFGNISFSEVADNRFELGQAAKVLISGKEVGTLGMITEKLMNKFGLKSPIAFAEINVIDLYQAALPISYKSVSRYPESQRDINMIFSQKTPIADIEDKIQLAGILKKYEIIDIYQGVGLPEGKKSVTISLTFGSSERTLSDLEISKEIENILKQLESTGGKIRT
jgi:phenylalanyl-tRNA synthetase beta subunit